MKDEIKKVMEQQERILQIQEQQAEKIKHLEGLDLVKNFQKEGETDEVIDKRVANLLELANKLKGLNGYKKDAIFDYLSKKSGVRKTDLVNVVRTFESYLEDLL